MKCLLVMFCLTCLVCDAADNSLAGEWKISAKGAGRESLRNCSIAQNEAELSGTCDEGKSKLTGKVDGRKVTLTVAADSEGGAVTLLHNGTVEDASTIRGTVTAVEFSIDGDFVATRSK